MNLTPEQASIVQSKLDSFNVDSSNKHTIESFLAEVGMQSVRIWQSQAITQKGLEMVSIAQERLTEENRIKFTNEVEQLLVSYIVSSNK